VNPSFFFCVFLSPFVCSCGSLKGSRIGFAKFFRRNTTPLRVWRFPRNPLGLETLPFQFAFYLCRWNNQTSGDRKTYRLLPFPLLRGNERTSWFYGLSIRKRLPYKAGENKKSAVLTCDTECPRGFQFANGDSRFRSSADSRACLIALSVKLHRQGYKT